MKRRGPQTARARSLARRAAKAALDHAAWAVINQVARRFARRFPFGGPTQDDLVQEGWIVWRNVRKRINKRRGEWKHYLTKSLHNRYNRLLRESWRLIRVRKAVEEVGPRDLGTMSTQDILAECAEVLSALHWSEAHALIWLVQSDGDVRRMSRESGIRRAELYQFRKNMAARISGEVPPGSHPPMEVARSPTSE